MTVAWASRPSDCGGQPLCQLAVPLECSGETLKPHWPLVTRVGGWRCDSVAGVSAHERLQIEALLQRGTPSIDPGSGLAIFDAWVRSGRRAYDAAVAPAMRDAGLNSNAVAPAFDSDSSLGRVVRGVLSAEVIVVDVSTLNASVFYVLGLAHALGRCPLLITCCGEATLPFDLRTLRCLHYRDRTSDLLRLREELARALRVFRDSADADSSTT